MGLLTTTAGPMTTQRGPNPESTVSPPPSFHFNHRSSTCWSESEKWTLTLHALPNRWRKVTLVRNISRITSKSGYRKHSPAAQILRFLRVFFWSHPVHEQIPIKLYSSGSGRLSQRKQENEFGGQSQHSIASPSDQSGQPCTKHPAEAEACSRTLRHSVH